MPTGYTAKLMENGQSFQEFVMFCARAMGVCVMMRDDSLDKPIPEKFEPSDYELKEMAKARTELDRLLSMTKKQAKAYGLEHKEP